MTKTTNNEGTRTVRVYYGNHDSGGQSEGHMIREAGESAERTANLLRQCGYRLVRIEGQITAPPRLGGSGTPLLWVQA